MSIDYRAFGMYGVRLNEANVKITENIKSFLGGDLTENDGLYGSDFENMIGCLCRKLGICYDIIGNYYSDELEYLVGINIEQRTLEDVFKKFTNKKEIMLELETISEQKSCFNIGIRVS
jgi:hypothetical protein